MHTLFAIFRKSCVASFLLGLLFTSSPAKAAERPAVGLALSGGSALGLAHVGVIRYFEEHHIPIDRIGGTSMGGLVGGFYATGMNADELTAVLEQTDLGAMLNPSPKFSDLPIVDKQQWNRTFGDVTMRFGRGFSLPAGLNTGAALSLLLSRFTKVYAGVSDFDQLPTPFRCVATDLVSGQAIVLSHGSLPVAMRATMSLPGVFTPVRLDHMVLVDGGILENIPVDPVRQMGAQTVIAVELATPKPTPDQFNSLAGVLRQTISLGVSRNEQLSLARADLVITVDTARFASTDFTRWREIVAAGYEAAQKHSADLARFQLSDQEWAEYLAQRHARMKPSGTRGQILSVSAASPSFEKNAQFEIRRKTGGQPVTEEELDKVLTGMVAATAVSGASYEWQQDGDNSGYKIKFAGRPTDQVLARISPLYTYSSGEPSRFGLRLTTITIPRTAYKFRFLGAMDVGYDPGIMAEAYKPLGGSEYFVAPQLFLQRTHFNQYDGAARTTEVRDRVGGAFYSGIGTWRFAQLRLGATAGYDSYSSAVPVDGVVSRDGGFTAPEVRWIVNTQDSGGLPTRGVRSEGSAGYMFRQNYSYPYLQNEFSLFQPVRSNLTLFALSREATSFGRKLGFYDQFSFGAQRNIAAFRYQEFHANTAVTAGGGLILRGPAIPHIVSRTGVGAWYEAGRFDLGSEGWQTHQSTSLGIFFPAHLGTSGISVSFDEEGRARFRLMLGSF